MAQIYENFGHLILLLLLLVCSAFFSASETALFNLSRRQTRQFRKSRHKLSNLTAKLIDNPGQLLGCILFGNMTVNVLFYAVSSVLIVKVRQEMGITFAAVSAVAAFCLVVIFGEILPKSLAYANSKSISLAAAVPLFLFQKVFRPLLFAFRFLLVGPVLRLLLGHLKRPGPITTGEFISLIEHVRKRGLITDDENRLIGEIVELGFLKVRNVMQPRVDMIACAVTESSRSMIEIMRKNHLTKMPVYVGTIDNIIGQVFFRQLLLHPDTSPDKLVQKINFVPEQKTIESLLEFFRRSGSDTAVVVDEYGGIAGLVGLEDIVEQLVGPVEMPPNIKAVEQTGHVEYRLSGNLPIHDWAEALGINPRQIRISTLAGLVTASLGRIPRPGDVARFNNLKFTVEKMKKRRIGTLILTLEPLNNNADCDRIQ